MAKRVCVVCGKEKELLGGKTCPKGHFVCRGCIFQGWIIGRRTQCPICQSKLS
ncbi:MAG: hypothetical protein GXO78_06900 [Calditrichaeota bacterium]|nr:hypothetical protein [Calditrichota bacterium]